MPALVPFLTDHRMTFILPLLVASVADCRVIGRGSGGRSPRTRGYEGTTERSNLSAHPVSLAGYHTVVDHSNGRMINSEGPTKIVGGWRLVFFCDTVEGWY